MLCDSAAILGFLRSLSNNPLPARLPVEEMGDISHFYYLLNVESMHLSQLNNNQDINVSFPHIN